MNGKGAIQKQNRKTVLLGGCERKKVFFFVKMAYFIDDRQITHLICVLKHLLSDFLRGCFGPFI